MTSSFFQLTPDRVLDAVEQSGAETTGLCYALNSLENRVYEVELDDRRRVVAKFYRPGRWSRETILDEHRLLLAMKENEIPVCPPLPFPDGDTLHATQDGIWFSLFPRVGGRSPDDPTLEQYAQLGRLLARIHNVSSSLSLSHRPSLSPATYGIECLQQILEKKIIPPNLESRYQDAVQRLVALGEQRWHGVRDLVIHADCHRGNLLLGRDGWFFLDFDDSARGPAAQDFWLLLPGRPKECQAELEAMVEGYEMFRPFNHRELRLIEVLRGLRYVRYAAWISTRWDDPSFPRAFPHFGTEVYWQGQINDLYEQLAQLSEDESWS
jgi:Ser/Thr protein kinase RdoA (MazF antagonist)